MRGSEVVLDDATLDRIDDVVAPGRNVYEPTAAVLTDASRRRRPITERADA